MTANTKLVAYVILFLVTVGFSLHSFAGCCDMFSKKNKTHFDWLATETAPKNYPMIIIDGTFYYHNEKGGLYVPTAAQINPGWGKGVSTHVVGETYKPLPDRLDIRYFSLTENKMYQGSFDLPYEKILALFKAGILQNRMRDSTITDPNYDTMMVGVAPGGAVAVWVSGLETREVFFGQAQEYEDELRDGLNNKVKDRDSFIKIALESAHIPPEVLTDILKNGPPIGKWAEYRKQYRWEPSFQIALPRYVNIALLNGEKYRLYMPLTEAEKIEPRAIPSIFSFVDPNGHSFRIDFDEQETMDTLKKLGSNQEKIYIDIDPKIPRELTTVKMRNDKESVTLTKIKVSD